MKPIFHHRQVNGPFEDPVVYLRILHEKGAMLFDAGDISRLSVRDLYKITDVFITHTHLDHFIGFDTVLRVLLRREDPVTFFGPAGIIKRIEGKLSGYTWNLIEEYPLVIHVVEVRDDLIDLVYFRACERFQKVNTGSMDFSPTILENDLLTVKAVILEHDVPSLGFSIKEKIHINIDKDKLKLRGFPVGDWLNGLKKAIRNGAFEEVVDTGKGYYKVSQLNDIYTITEGQKVSYIMDSSPVESNIERITEFVKDSDALYIESYFLQNDIKRATQRNHLTAKIAGLIAKRADVKSLHLLHFSPRYRENPEMLINEAFEEFRR